MIDCAICHEEIRQTNHIMCLCGKHYCNACMTSLYEQIKEKLKAERRSDKDELTSQSTAVSNHVDNHTSRKTELQSCLSLKECDEELHKSFIEGKIAGLEWVLNVDNRIVDWETDEVIHISKSYLMNEIKKLQAVQNTMFQLR